MQEDRTIARRRFVALAGGAALIVALVGVRLVAPLDAPGGSAAPRAAAGAGATTEEGPIVGFAPGIGVPAVDPLPWTGVTWDPLATTGIETRAGQGVRGLVHAGDRLLAQGRMDDPRPLDNPDHLGDVAVVWLSSDGVRWDARPIVAGVPPDSVTETNAVAAGPRGIVVGGGVCCRLEAPALWWSSDGQAWEIAAVPDLVPGAWIQDLAAGPDGFVAIGGIGERGAIWTSADGRTWSAVDPDDAGLVRGGLSSVVATETGYVAVGQDDPGAEGSDAAIWASVGLEQWRRVAIDDPALVGIDEASMTSIVPFAGGFFAVGGTGTSKDRKQCQQLLGGAAVASLSDTALSCGWLREMTWHSLDGETWTRADPFGADGEYPPDFAGPPPGRAPVSWTFIAAGGPGLVALQDEISRDEAAGNTLGIWTSAEGASWTRIADAPLDAADYPVGFAVSGRRLFVITELGRAWIGTVRP
jgi:hypothetical protein